MFYAIFLFATPISFDLYFGEHNLTLSTGTNMSTDEAIKQAVQAGMDLGLVSMLTVALGFETKRLVVLDVDPFPIRRHWYVVHRKGKRLKL